MNVKNVEKQEKGMVKLTIEVGADKFNAAIEQVYRRNKGQISIPGFRKGKAPRKLIEKMYGAELFYEDAINDVYPKALEEAVAEKEIAMVGYPQMNVESAGPEGITFTATIAEKPVVTVENYKGIVAPYADIEVTDKDVEIAMIPYLRRAESTIEVDRPAENGDTVCIDFLGTKDGVEFQGGKGENFDLELGSGSFIPGFEEQLVGVKAGDETVVNVTFPEDYSAAELSGADAQFQVKVHSVKTTQEPVLDDEFAKDVSEFQTLDELKAHLREECKKDKEKAAQHDFEIAVLDKLIEQTEMEIPETMIEFERDRMVNDYNERLQSAGVSLEQYFSLTGSNMNEFIDTLRTDAVRVIQRELVLEAVARQESGEPEEEDIDRYVARAAQDYEMDPEEMKSAVPEENLKAAAKIDKAAQLVFAAAVHGPAPEKEETKDESKGE